MKQVAACTVSEAYQSTTTISANLIEGAAVGQGDERLMAVVDGVATGQLPIEECLDCVLARAVRRESTR